MNQPLQFTIGADGSIQILPSAQGGGGEESNPSTNEAAQPHASAGNSSVAHQPNSNETENAVQPQQQQPQQQGSVNANYPPQPHNAAAIPAVQQQQLPAISPAQLQSLAAINPLLFSPALIPQLLTNVNPAATNVTGGATQTPTQPIAWPQAQNLPQAASFAGSPATSLTNAAGLAVSPQQALAQQPPPQQQQQAQPQLPQVAASNPIPNLPFIFQQQQLPLMQPFLQASFQQALLQGQGGVAVVQPGTIVAPQTAMVASAPPTSASSVQPAPIPGMTFPPLVTNPGETAGLSSKQAPAPEAGFPCYGRIVPLYNDMDEDTLSEYQCLARKQIEIFEATQEDLDSSAQGRNKPICVGQVGIRCRHCGRLPRKRRAKGGVYFPSQLSGVYQTAQNMANR